MTHVKGEWKTFRKGSKRRKRKRKKERKKEVGSLELEIQLLLLFTKYDWGQQIKAIKVGKSRSMYGREGKLIKNFGGGN